MSDADTTQTAIAPEALAPAPSAPAPSPSGGEPSGGRSTAISKAVADALSAPGENITVEQLRARRIAAARKAAQPAPAAPPLAPAPAPQPQASPPSAPTAHAPGSEEVIQDPDTAPPAADADSDLEADPLTPPPTEQPAPAIRGRGLPPEIELAIEEAIQEPDKAKLTKKLVKRIHELVDQRNEAMQRAQPQDPPKPQTAPVEPPAPASAHPELAPYDTKIATLENAIARLEENPEGLSVPQPDGNAVELSAADVTRLRREYSQQLTRLTAERATIALRISDGIKAQAQANWSQARTVYPWIDQKQAPEFQQAITELRQLGPLGRQLMQHPAFPLIVGRYVAGLNAERTAAARKPATPAPMSRPRSSAPPPPVVATPAAVPTVAGDTDAVRQAEEQYRKTGRMTDLIKLRKARAATA